MKVNRCDEGAHTANKKKSCLCMSYAPSTPTVYTPGEDLSVNTGVSLLR